MLEAAPEILYKLSITKISTAGFLVVNRNGYDSFGPCRESPNTPLVLQGVAEAQLLSGKSVVCSKK